MSVRTEHGWQRGRVAGPQVDPVELQHLRRRGRLGGTASRCCTLVKHRLQASCLDKPFLALTCRTTEMQGDMTLTAVQCSNCRLQQRMVHPPDGTHPARRQQRVDTSFHPRAVTQNNAAEQQTTHPRSNADFRAMLLTPKQQPSNKDKDSMQE